MTEQVHEEFTAPEPLADGIYFGLSFEDYLADPALGSNDIKNLLISPLQYWVNSHLNPNRQPDNGSAATRLGTLIHEVILENPNKLFATKPEGMSFTTKAGKEWKAKMIEKGAKILTPDEAHTLRTVEMAAQKSGLAAALEGAVPEVSYIWTHPSGHRCKIRIDAMQPHQSFDLKTFANAMSKDLETCIAHAVANNCYHISAFWYRTGIDHMIATLRNGSAITPQGETPEQTDMLAALRNHDGRHHHWYCFLEKDGVPNVVIREFNHRTVEGTEPNAYWRAARNEVDRATSTFAKFSERFKPGEIWMDQIPWKTFDDVEFGAARWILED